MLSTIGNGTTPPTYAFEENNGIYKIAVTITDESQPKNSMIEEAKKSSLMGMAYINELAKRENPIAQQISSIYRGYHTFFIDRNKDALLEICNTILENPEADEFVKEIALYLKSSLEQNPIDGTKGSAFIESLIPSIRETLLMEPPKLIGQELLVQVPEMEKPHNAFPDLIKYRGEYYAAFREGKKHVEYEDFGTIRILKGNFLDDKWEWKNLALLSTEAYDLRDPKFFIDSDDQLHLILDGSVINEKDQTAKLVPHVAHYDSENDTWKIQEAIVDSSADGPIGQWIWKITWNDKENAGYGFSYAKGNILCLMKTTDSINFEKIAEISTDLLDQKESLTEATIQFKTDGTAIAFIRTQRNGLIAVSTPESGYKEWSFNVIPFRVGGPTFAFSENEDKIWAATRYFFLNQDNSLDETTIVASMNERRLVPLLRLRSSGDSSYPGIVMENDNRMTVLYYGSESEEKTNIYIARIQLP